MEPLAGAVRKSSGLSRGKFEANATGGLAWLASLVD
jgi:hypothetical protein